MYYLCNRKREMVPWMSGLVSGLQNRVRRFESARYLYCNAPLSEEEGGALRYLLGCLGRWGFLQTFAHNFVAFLYNGESTVVALSLYLQRDKLK